MFDQPSIEEHIGKLAIQLADTVKAHCIISAEKYEDEKQDYEDPYLNIKLGIFKRVDDNNYKKIEYKTKIKRPEHGQTLSPKELLIDAISHHHINKGERVICILDASLGSGYNLAMFIFEVDNLFFNMSQHKLTKNVRTNVMETIFDIALDISKYGREGRPVGTMFIIGGPEIRKYTKQLIINPFEFLEDDKRNILNPELRESIIEFSMLDGAFVIDLDGKIMSTGTYIDIDTDHVVLPSGFGTKHRTAAAITDATDAIAVVISESGGKIRVFSKGKIVMST